MGMTDFDKPAGHEDASRKNIDFTKVPGNPAFELRQLYEELMSIGPDTIHGDPNSPEAKQAAELLANRAIGIARAFSGKGMSVQHCRQFEMAVRGAVQRNKALDNVKSLITNFVMAAAGEGVLYIGRQGGGPSPGFNSRPEGFGSGPVRVPESAEINTLANLMNEDGGYKVELTKELRDILKIANHYGFEINIAESEEQAWELGGMNITESQKKMCDKCKREKCVCKKTKSESKDPHEAINEALKNKKKAIKEDIGDDVNVSLTKDELDVLVIIVEEIAATQPEHIMATARCDIPVMLEKLRAAQSTGADISGALTPGETTPQPVDTVPVVSTGQGTSQVDKFAQDM